MSIGDVANKIANGKIRRTGGNFNHFFLVIGGEVVSFDCAGNESDCPDAERFELVAPCLARADKSGL